MSALPSWEAARCDADLALAAASGDRDAFAAIYDRYADRLHDFCVGMLRDRDAAADCVQDVFCTAATRLPQLREPDKLRSWLYAIARNEALRRIRARRREEVSEDLPETGSDEPGPDALAARNELAELIAEAAGGLSDRDRAVLELAYRHGLDGPELAEALGVSATNANTMVGRLRDTIERSLGALLVSRDARAALGGGCAELASVLDGWDGQFTVLMRKRIARHIDSCPACDKQRRSMVNPVALLGSLPVFIPAPNWLRGHTLTLAPLPHTPLPHSGTHPGITHPTSAPPAEPGGTAPAGTTHQPGTPAPADPSRPHGHQGSRGGPAGPLQPSDPGAVGHFTPGPVHTGSWWPPGETDPDPDTGPIEPVHIRDVGGQLTPGGPSLHGSLPPPPAAVVPLNTDSGTGTRKNGTAIAVALLVAALITVVVLGRGWLVHPSTRTGATPTAPTLTVPGSVQPGSVPATQIPVPADQGTGAPPGSGPIPAPLPPAANTRPGQPLTNNGPVSDTAPASGEDTSGSRTIGSGTTGGGTTGSGGGTLGGGTTSSGGGGTPSGGETPSGSGETPTGSGETPSAGSSSDGGSVQKKAGSSAVNKHTDDSSDAGGSSSDSGSNSSTLSNARSKQVTRPDSSGNTNGLK